MHIDGQGAHTHLVHKHGDLKRPSKIRYHFIEGILAFVQVEGQPLSGFEHAIADSGAQNLVDHEVKTHPECVGLLGKLRMKERERIIVVFERRS